MAQSVNDVTTSSAVMLAQNPNRKYLLIENLSDTNIYIKFGGDAVVAEGIMLTSGGGSYAMSRLVGNIDTRAVHAIHQGTGDKAISFTEYP